MINTKRFGRNILVFFLLIAVIANTASAVKIEVIPADQNIKPGQQFTVDISVIPEGNEKIAGVQSDILFNKDILNINNVEEGNLLKQGGINTFFNKGNIAEGQISNIYGAIITPGKSISMPGIFATIKVTANGIGTSPIDLRNVVVSDPEGGSLKTIIKNGTVKVGPKDISIPETSVPNGDEQKKSPGFEMVLAMTVLSLIYIIRRYKTG